MLAFGGRIAVALGFAWILLGAQTLTVRRLEPAIPNSGPIGAIAVNPRDERNVLVASENGGVFRSIDGGQKVGPRR